MAQRPQVDPAAASNVVSIYDRSTALSEQALEQAFCRKRSAIVQYVRFRLGDASDADDIAQTVFLRLWQKRADLHGDNLEALLFVTARNIANDLLRSRTRQRLLHRESVLDPETIGGVANPDLPEQNLIARQNLDLISKILLELPNNCRSAFVRYKFEEHGYAEIARDMGVSESMVRKHVLRAVAYCAVRLAEMEEWT